MLELTNGPVFSPLARWDVVSDGRLAVADGTEYRIRIVRPESGETTILERPIPSRPVTEADRERERERKRLSYERPAGMASFGGSGGGRITP